MVKQSLSTTTGRYTLLTLPYTHSAGKAKENSLTSARVEFHEQDLTAEADRTKKISLLTSMRPSSLRHAMVR